MSVYHALVLNTVCRSNHHRIAVMALSALRGEAAGRWRDLLLHHHKALLAGAKAPDEVFKDFKNHVLHVRDGFWGGAVEAAEEWYRRTVRALKDKDWPLAAHSAGVLSHYVTDPCQPFHTGQTEEENTIHRAAEWSFSKAFPELKRILDVDLGGVPDVPVPDGRDWLSAMIREAAVKANAHYETIVEHYDFAVGAKNPPAGLDQELKDVIAGQIGYATALLARVFDRAFAEAAVSPPAVNLVLDTIFDGLKVPIRTVLAAIEDAGERRIVAAQYEEFQKAGKLRATLSEDDRVVRALHAEEVLKVPLSTLDCRWPRETGLAHGAGAPARVTPKKRPKIEPKPAPIVLDVAAVAPKTDSPKPDVPKAAPVEIAPTAVGCRLSPDQPVVDAPSIGPKTAERLHAIGVWTVGELIAADPADAAKRMKAGHITPKLVTDWQDQSRLLCTVPQITPAAAQILVGCDVRSREDLAGANVVELTVAAQQFAGSSEGQRLLRDAPTPSAEIVQGWIAAARSPQGRAAA